MPTDPTPESAPPLSPERDPHLSDETEGVTGEQARAKDQIPTEPSTDTENQPS